MRNGPTSTLRRMILAGAGTASLMSSVGAIAQTAPAPDREVSVAIIDSDVRRIDFKDPNVRVVDMTPKAPEGASFTRYKMTDAYSHGDIVASSFVREYRKLDPDARIVIYTVDPFVRKEGNASSNFSMRILNEALPRMRQAGVRVAITAFGIADETAGRRIADAFSGNGMALFAAIPNEEHDRGIYPAAIPGVISVADTSSNGALASDRRMATWVTLAISGNHGSAHNASDAKGTSFAVAHAGAYGAYILSRSAETSIGGLGEAIASHGSRMTGRYGDRPMVTARIGGSDMIAAVGTAYGSSSGRKIPPIMTRGPGTETVMMAMNARSGPSR